MARVKRGVTAHKRHKRLLNDAEGARAPGRKLVKPAREAPAARAGLREPRPQAAQARDARSCGSSGSTRRRASTA